MLSIRQNTPAGSYWLRVGVSDGVWPDVMSGVRVHVRDLEEKAILSSASLRLSGNITHLMILHFGGQQLHECCSDDQRRSYLSQSSQRFIVCVSELLQKQ